MERIPIKASYGLACDLMDYLYSIYMTIVEEMGGDVNSKEAQREGQKYARRKFMEIADEFENALPMTWLWGEYIEEKEEDKND